MKAIFSGWENKLLGSRTWPCECQGARDARHVQGPPKHTLSSAGTIINFNLDFALYKLFTISDFRGFIFKSAGNGMQCESTGFTSTILVVRVI